MSSNVSRESWKYGDGVHQPWARRQLTLLATEAEHHGCQHHGCQTFVFRDAVTD